MINLKILSFDIEEWFHINDSTWVAVEHWPSLEARVIENTSIILSFLKEHNTKATFFILGWIAEKYPELVHQIASDGHDIGYHSYYHRIPKFQSKAEFEKDLETGLPLLEKLTSRKIEFYRAPNFSLKNKWMIDCLIDHGITVSSSIKNPIFHREQFLPDQPFVFTKNDKQIIEFPLTTKKLPYIKFAYSGSGYFRILPFPLIKQIYNRKSYLMMYFHPNDFDTHIPKPSALGFIRNTMNSIGTDTTLPKLERLSLQYTFISISQALQELTISKLPVIEY